MPSLRTNASLLFLFLAIGIGIGFFTGRELRPGVTEPGALPLPARSPAFARDAGSARLLVVHGEALARDERGGATALVVGAALPRRGELATGAGGRAAVLARAGVEVQLDHASSTTFGPDPDQPRLRGRVYVAVRTAQPTSFDVDDGMTVVASDAEFVVMGAIGSREVHVGFGHVMLTSGDRSVRVGPGETGSVRDAQLVVVSPTASEAAATTAWQSELLLALRR